MTSLITISLPVTGFVKVSHGPPVNSLGAEFRLRQLVAPFAEGSLGELHDVALVHQRHRDAIVIDGILDRLADQPLRTLA